jgi:hypothetical protein
MRELFLSGEVFQRTDGKLQKKQEMDGNEKNIFGR